MTTPIGWPEAQPICDIPEVREALDKFAADAHDENMLAMVSAILNAHAHEQDDYAGLEGVTEGEWEDLAIALCKEAGGDPFTLVWTGGAVPEPWGDAWMEYQGDAQHMIALVRKHVPASALSPTPSDAGKDDARDAALEEEADPMPEPTPPDVRPDTVMAKPMPINALWDAIGVYCEAVIDDELAACGIGDKVDPRIRIGAAKRLIGLIGDRTDHNEPAYPANRLHKDAHRTPVAAHWNGLSDTEKARFVDELCALGTGFVTPLFAVIDNIEKALRERNRLNDAALSSLEVIGKGEKG